IRKSRDNWSGVVLKFEVIGNLSFSHSGLGWCPKSLLSPVCLSDLTSHQNLVHGALAKSVVQKTVTVKGPLLPRCRTFFYASLIQRGTSTPEITTPSGPGVDRNKH